jgi:hypothetical protein
LSGKANEQASLTMAPSYSDDEDDVDEEEENEEEEEEEEDSDGPPAKKKGKRAAKKWKVRRHAQRLDMTPCNASSTMSSHHRLFCYRIRASPSAP